MTLDNDVIEAAISVDIPLMQRLIDQGADVNGALYFASSKGRVELVGYLLDAGADVNHPVTTAEVIDRDTYDETITSLRVAAIGVYTETVRLLLERGADPNAAGIFCGATALLEGAQRSHTEIVRLLLEAGAGPDALDRYKKATALDGAVMRGDLPTLRLLLEHGATASFRSATFKWAPAAAQGAEMVSLLLTHDADPNIAGVWDRTPLMWAAENASPEAVELLLRAGADVSATAKQYRRPKGITAMEIAREKRRKDIVQILRNAGACR